MENARIAFLRARMRATASAPLVYAMFLPSGPANAGYNACFKTMFRETLGEIDREWLDCSTIAHRGANAMFLAHNEMDDCRYPLCYARVRLHKKTWIIQEFLTVSYIPVFWKCCRRQFHSRFHRELAHRQACP
jgi:hypothetical protein